MAQLPDNYVSPEALEKGHQPHTESAFGLTLFLIFFGLAALIIHAGIWFLLRAYGSMPRSADQPLSQVNLKEQFVSPQLQPSQDHPYLPREDLLNLRARENRLFLHMGWAINLQTGEAVIPHRIVEQLPRSHRSPAQQAQPQPGANRP